LSTYIAEHTILHRFKSDTLIPHLSLPTPD
jgi:hypothetical protein